MVSGSYVNYLCYGNCGFPLLVSVCNALHTVNFLWITSIGSSMCSIFYIFFPISQVLPNFRPSSCSHIEKLRSLTMTNSLTLIWRSSNIDLFILWAVQELLKSLLRTQILKLFSLAMSVAFKVQVFALYWQIGKSIGMTRLSKTEVLF